MDGQRSALPHRRFGTRGSAAVSSSEPAAPLRRASAPRPGGDTRRAPRRRTPWDPFSLGIASGDPTPQGFVLWTRLLPEGTPLDGSVMKQEPYGVRYEIADDEDFRPHRPPRQRGSGLAGVLTVHVEIAGLRAGPLVLVPLHVAATAVSPVGRTRTAPAPDAGARACAFAFASCQNCEDGYYTALRSTSPGGPRPRRPPRRLHLRGRRAAGGRCAPHDGAETRSSTTTAFATRSTRATRLQAAHARLPWLVDVGRPRGGEQLRRPRDRPRRRSTPELFRPPGRGVPGVLGTPAAARSPQAARTRTCRSTAASTGATWPTFHVLDTRQYRRRPGRACGRRIAARLGLLPERSSIPARRCSATSSGPGCYDGLAQAADGTAGTSSPTRSASPRRTLARQRGGRRFGPDSWDGYAGERAGPARPSRRARTHEPRRRSRRQAPDTRCATCRRATTRRTMARRCHGVHRHVHQQRRPAARRRDSAPEPFNPQINCGRTCTTATSGSS